MTIIHIYIQICRFIYIYMQNTYDTMIKTSEEFFKKIPLTLFERVVCVRGSWRLNKDCNILTSPNPPGIAVCRSRSPGLLNRGPGAPASLGHVLIPASSHQLVFKLTGGLEGPFCQVLVFSTTSFLRLLWSPTHWLPVFTELYNSSIAHSISILMASQAGICHFRHLWTGMLDHHQAEITVMQFRGPPLPVHQFFSVPWDFTLSHIVSQARLRDFFS